MRHLLFQEMGHDEPASLDAADAAFRKYLSDALPSGEFHAWLAVTPQGHVVGSGGVVIDHHPPSPMNPDGRIGYIMSLVTETPWRQRGIARHIMQTILQWLAEQGVRNVSLHASEQGRELYRELGFVESNEMRLTK
jgi:GNAT superfamily N-acetyltransferase